MNNNLKKKGRRSNQELCQAQEQIDQMISEIQKNTNLSEYNFIIVTSKIQLLQKQFQMFSHISDNITIKFIRNNVQNGDRKKIQYKMLLLFKGDQVEMCAELNHTFFQLMYITKDSEFIEFIIQYSNVSTFLKQKNVYQLMQIYNEKKNISQFKMSSIYAIKPQYQATESVVQMVDGHSKFVQDERISNFNPDDYNIRDVILTLLDNLYKGANNSDSFVLKLIIDKKLQKSKIEMYNVNEVNTLKSVTGDNFIVDEQKQETQEVVITFNQLHYIIHIYNQFTCLQILFPKSKKDYILIQQYIQNENYGNNDDQYYKDYNMEKNQLTITTLIDGNKNIIQQNSKIMNSLYGTQSMKEEVIDEEDDDDDLDITLN